MILHLNLSTHTTFLEVRQFLEALAPSRSEAHMGRTLLRRFSYWKLRKRAERGLLRTCLHRTTGLSRSQVAQLIAAYKSFPARPTRNEPSVGNSRAGFDERGEVSRLKWSARHKWTGLDAGVRDPTTPQAARLPATLHGRRREKGTASPPVSSAPCGR